MATLGGYVVGDAEDVRFCAAEHVTQAVKDKICAVWQRRCAIRARTYARRATLGVARRYVMPIATGFAVSTTPVFAAT